LIDEIWALLPHGIASFDYGAIDLDTLSNSVDFLLCRSHAKLGWAKGLDVLF
jgi:hypothetical protein